MGNCLKMRSSDDISLLRGNDVISGQDVFSSNERPFPVVTNSTMGTIYQHEPLQQVMYPTPSGNRPDTSNLADEDQIKLAKRRSLIKFLPIGSFEGSSKKSQVRECVICMIDFCESEPVRYLPCMHIYHCACIDDWLMRSLTCPSCLEPVDAALLTSYETT